eukprot:9481540-Pyramimonas_sp.AAC.1
MGVGYTELRDEKELLELKNSGCTCLSGGTHATPTSRGRSMSLCVPRSKIAIAGWTQTNMDNV